MNGAAIMWFRNDPRVADNPALAAAAASGHPLICLYIHDEKSPGLRPMGAAGTSADAAPYFRIFNPVLQGEKFDAAGDYVRRWIPELAKLSPEFFHRPWTAKSEMLETAGVVLGETYPKPIVDHAATRQRALAALSSIKAASDNEPCAEALAGERAGPVEHS